MRFASSGNGTISTPAAPSGTSASATSRSDVPRPEPPRQGVVELRDAAGRADRHGGQTIGVQVEEPVDELAAKCDYLYLHIDSDILDERYVPNHGTKEPNGNTRWYGNDEPVDDGDDEDDY